MNRMLSKCPVCAGDLFVSEMVCSGCSTRIESRFERCLFCSLSPEHLQFLETFLRCRGNLSGVGAEMGLSHPTVNKRLDALLAALGLREEEETPLPPPVRVNGRDSDRRRILEMLDRGDITAEEATRRLREL